MVWRCANGNETVRKEAKEPKLRKIVQETEQFATKKHIKAFHERWRFIRFRLSHFASTFNGFRSCPVASPSITALDWYDISAPSLLTRKLFFFALTGYGKLCMLIRCMSFESNTENGGMKIVSVNKLIIKINWAPCMCSRFSVDVIYAAHFFRAYGKRLRKFIRQTWKNFIRNSF